MGVNKGSRKLSSSSPEGAVRFRHQSTGAGADAVASLSFHFHRHRPLAKKKRIKSNGKKYSIKKATTYGWISFSTLLFTLVCGGFFSLFHIFIGQRRRDANANGMKKKGVRSHNEIINKDDVLSFPKSDEAFIASGEEGSLFSRVYYRANSTHCFGGPEEEKGAPNKEWLRIPTFADGVAAGPIIDCDPNDDVSCDLESALSDLEVIQSLRRGQSFQFFPPPQALGVHDVFQVTRMRKSSSTGVVFIDENHLAVASYGMKRIYLYQYDFDIKSARLLASVNTRSTPDLMHVDLKRNMLVVSQLKEGTQELFKYDLERKSIEAIKEVAAFGPKVKDQWCHEAAFYPSETSSVIAAGSIRMQKEETMMVSIFDYEHERVIAQYLTNSNDVTKGYQAKGVRFVDKRHMIVALSRAPVNSYEEEWLCQRRPPLDPSDAHTRIALIRLDFSVDDIAAASGEIEPVSSTSFSVIGVYDNGVGALDGIDYHDGMAMVVDQLNDKVVFLEVNPTAKNETLKLVSQHRGYILPHGVAFSKFRDHFAVTTYGDSSVIVSHKDSIRAFSRDAK
mmetsp:Transcript_6378/g.10763  ORF Transcript_6378/g.10763 Transcript_6378/m.10763 type:complete len:562 (-) Transcript_6378:226-1911(-)